VLKGETGSLRFLVHPELRSIVEGEDLVYIEDLLRDFLERAKQDPEALFKQLSSLGVGPLVVNVVGSNLSDCPSMQKISSQFVRL
jgi:hypothetical protein